MNPEAVASTQTWGHRQHSAGVLVSTTGQKLNKDLIWFRPNSSEKRTLSCAGSSARIVARSCHPSNLARLDSGNEVYRRFHHAWPSRQCLLICASAATNRVAKAMALETYACILGEYPLMSKTINCTVERQAASLLVRAPCTKDTRR